MLICFSCTKPVPELENFDAAQWKDDHQGCNGNRLKLIESLRAQRTKLKELSERSLIRLIGRPDRNDLSQRHEKFYYYYIEPSEKCDGGSVDALKLIVRFNAVGLSREVAIE